MEFEHDVFPSITADELAEELQSLYKSFGGNALDTMSEIAQYLDREKECPFKTLKHFYYLGYNKDQVTEEDVKFGPCSQEKCMAWCDGSCLLINKNKYINNSCEGKSIW